MTRARCRARRVRKAVMNQPGAKMEGRMTDALELARAQAQAESIFRLQI